MVESQQKDIPKLTRPHFEQYIYYRQGMKGSALENGEMMEEVLAISLFTEASTISTNLATLSDLNDEFWTDELLDVPAAASTMKRFPWMKTSSTTECSHSRHSLTKSTAHTCPPFSNSRSCIKNQSTSSEIFTPLFNPITYLRSYDSAIMLCNEIYTIYKYGTSKSIFCGTESTYV